MSDREDGFKIGFLCAHSDQNLRDKLVDKTE